MESKFSKKEIRKVKAHIGPIQILDYQNLTLAEAHQALGRDVSNQVLHILAARLDSLSESNLRESFNIGKNARTAIDQHLRNPDLHPLLRSALMQYMECLHSWSAGVGLNNFRHEKIRMVAGEGTQIDAVDLALFLQNDNVGCQSGVYRSSNDEALYIWHTEEDEDWNRFARFDRLRLASFTIPSFGDSAPTRAYSFIYPDLLPGPAFNWRSDGFVQLVDALFVKPRRTCCGLLANIAVWITLFLGSIIALDSIITTLSPFSDGYAVITVYLNEGMLQAQKIEFAGDGKIITSLEKRGEDYLLQVNIVSDKNASVAKDYETISRKERDKFEKRISRSRKMMKLLANRKDPINRLRKLLASRSGGEYAYSNPVVKAYFFAKLTQEELQIWIGEGPALLEDHLTSFEIILS